MYEHDFMTYIFQFGNKYEMMQLISFYMKINDIYSVTLIFMHMNVICKNNDDILNPLIEKFQNFKNEKTEEERSQIQLLLVDDRHYRSFFTNNKEVTLAMCSCHQ